MLMYLLVGTRTMSVSCLGFVSPFPFASNFELLESINSIDYDRVVSANAGTPHSLPFDWTSNCLSFKLFCDYLVRQFGHDQDQL